MLECLVTVFPVSITWKYTLQVPCIFMRYIAALHQCLQLSGLPFKECNEPGTIWYGLAFLNVLMPLLVKQQIIPMPPLPQKAVEISFRQPLSLTIRDICIFHHSTAYHCPIPLTPRL